MTKLTHGLQIINEHEGVRRVMSLQRYDTEGEIVFAIAVETTHPGEEPISTTLALSAYGYALFCLFMGKAPLDLEKFAVTDEGGKA